MYEFPFFDIIRINRTPLYERIFLKEKLVKGRNHDRREGRRNGEKRDKGGRLRESSTQRRPLFLGRGNNL